MRKIALIVGAGASIDIRLPSASSLWDDIVRVCKESKVDPFFQNAAQLAQNRYGDLNPLAEAMQRSPRASIDEFLRDRQEFLDVGRCLIAMVISFHQRQSLFSQRNQYWISHLFNAIVRSEKWVDSYQIEIATYNYDTAIEWFLEHAFNSCFPGRKELQAKFISQIEIHHLHGIGVSKTIPSDLGSNLWMQSVDWDHAARSIRLVFDQPDDVVLHNARLALRNADLVGVFGFGFGRENTVRLLNGIEPALEAEWIATRFGIPNKELPRFVINGFPFIDLLESDVDCFGCARQMVARIG